MSVVAAYVLFVMMSLTVADVLGRYLFFRPVTGAHELVGFLLVCAATWGLAYCQLQKRHIRVTFLFERLSQKTGAIITILAYVIGLGISSLMFWQVVKLFNRYLVKGVETETLGMPYTPFIIILAIGVLMLAIILIKDLIHSFISLRRE